MSDFVKQLKEQINIADIVGEYVRLRKTGSNHMGLCPFHGERSPSFSVAERKGIYHCFGCQRSGDVISFIQEIQGISFQDAVRSLASRYGVKLPPEFSRGSGQSARVGASSEDELEVFYKLNRFVAQFYHEKLMGPDGERARQYFVNRGITEATMKSAYLGYASAQWSEVYEFLAAKKAPLDKAEALGLIRRKSTGADADGRAHYDLFRDRVMFPVVDSRGRVIAFGGRSLSDADGPKYLNSSESPIFKKGSHLYGLFSAQKDIRAEDLCVVVEGFMDCVALQQAGIGCTVATLGTALTERQVTVIKRLTREVVLLFDGDSAGQEAQARAMETFLNEDVVVRAVSLPDQLDPDEFVRERGPEELLRLIKSAPYLLDQRILELAGTSGGHLETRARAVDEILPWIAKITSETAQLVRLQEVSGLFGVPLEALRGRLRGLQPQSVRGSGSVTPIGRPTVKAKVNVARQPALDALDLRFIEMLLLHPKFALAVEDPTAVTRGLESESSRALAEKLFAAEPQQAGYGAEVLEWAEHPKLKAVIARALVECETIAPKTDEARDAVVREIKDLEKKLIGRGMERQRESLRAILLKADGSGDPEKVSKLMNEYQELVKTIKMEVV